MGGWTLWNGWLIKTNYMVKNELYACLPTETKVQQKKVDNINIIITISESPCHIVSPKTVTSNFKNLWE